MKSGSDDRAEGLTRRQFVAASALGGVAVAVGCGTSRRGNWEYLSDGQARTLTAICDQIVPADQYPSASQAGVLTFIDRQLIRHYRSHQDAYRDGLEQANAISRKRFGLDLADAPPDQQWSVPWSSRPTRFLSWCARTRSRVTTARHATAAIAMP